MDELKKETVGCLINDLAMNHALTFDSRDNFVKWVVD